MGFLAILSNNLWCLRVQHRFQSAVERGDRKSYMEFMTEGISRSLKGALSARELRHLDAVRSADREEVNTRLTTAFQRGLHGDPAVPLSLSNAMDEVIREAASIAKQHRLTR